MVALCILLVVACYCDYRKKRIPNYLIIAIVLVGVIWRFLLEGYSGAIACALQALLIGAMLYPLFKVGALGAGDVKLFGATAGCLPFEKIFMFLFVSLLISAIISLVKLWKYDHFFERLQYFYEYLADIFKSGRFRLYLDEDSDDADIRLCLSGPILLSLLLYLGGAY